MANEGRIRVMMTTEGTYPFHQGGVSTWCDVLTKRLDNIDYTLYSIIMNPYVTQKFTLPSGANLIKVPLWGTEDATEHLKIPFSQIYALKKNTSEKIVEHEFLPFFEVLITEILAIEKNTVRFSTALVNMHQFFKHYDYTESFKSQAVWHFFKDFVYALTTRSRSGLAVPTIFDLTQSLGWLYRFFTVLNTPVPEVDVTHSAAAAFCGIPCVLAKYERGTPFLLTEHGVYLREQYLSVNRTNYSPYLKAYLLRLVHSVVAMNYQMADQVSPVCYYNTRWEKKFGVPASRIKVIYNGVDSSTFSPGPKNSGNSRPTVISVARIDPVKDLLTLLRSAAIVKKLIPDVQFIVYGTVFVQAYYEECLALRQALGLDDSTFLFAGHTDDVPGVLRQADVVALSSISEAFPYSVVEAMMAGKAIVSTDVGGVSEALGDCGIVVTPRKPEELAMGIITLLDDGELRHTLAEDARNRALDYFTIEASVDQYMNAYRRLVFKTVPRKSDVTQDQKNLVEKGYALAELGFWLDAIRQFNQAIRVKPDSPIVPLLYAEMAEAYLKLGHIEDANHQLEKARLISQIHRDRIA